MEHDRPDFPSEAEWLQQPAPPVSADFVERTLAAVDAQRAGTPAALQELLAAHRVPEVSPDFVERTYQRLLREQSPSWQRLMRRYHAPEPTGDFVERVLRAIAPAPAPRRARALRSWTAAAAAAVVCVGLGWWWSASTGGAPRTPALQGELVQATGAFSPDRWGTAMTRLRPQLRLPSPDPMLALATRGERQ